MPMALQLKESELTLPGACISHEIPDAKHPMLLSQSAQAKIGMVKNMRKGVIMIEDYGEEIEVVRLVGTELFMIRIDHLDLDMLRGC